MWRTNCLANRNHLSERRIVGGPLKEGKFRVEPLLTRQYSLSNISYLFTRTHQWFATRTPFVQAGWQITQDPETGFTLNRKVWVARCYTLSLNWIFIQIAFIKTEFGGRKPRPRVFLESFADVLEIELFRRFVRAEYLALRAWNLFEFAHRRHRKYVLNRPRIY